jgi:tetratricopeptide (TPR) repeat protein
METKLERCFVRSYLPWLVALGACIFFFFTLNRSLSLTSVQGLARVAGWDWHPVYVGPLFYVLTWPIRWLPAPWQLVAGSVFSMVCALLTLALLARSVALLPHDRTREQRQRESGPHGLLSIPAAWLPPLVAVLVCGLQLSFWEQATVISAEMLDLLVLAYVIRCLLEYRVDGRESWLARMAFVYGLGTANNWAMIGWFPAVLIALVWIMGLNFFRYRFLIRTILWGLAGMLLYLLLPLLHSWTDPVYADFMRDLRSNFGFQKQALGLFRPYLVVFFSLSSLLPLLLIGIRWPTSMADVSAAGFVAVTALMYVLHVGFFAFCLWNSFDPKLSPRQMSGGAAMLSFYYLSALCVGYFCGYFLLVFGRAATKGWERASEWRRVLNPVVSVAVWALAVGVPAGLLYVNLPQVQARNSSELNQYGQRLAESLPATGSVVLSDDPVRLYAVQAALGARADQYVLLDTGALPQQAYHRYLKQKYPGRLPEAPSVSSGAQASTPMQLVDFVKRVAAQNAIYYLHPSFGYYFEQFYLLPHKGVYELKGYATNTVELPPLSAGLIAEQEQYWRQVEREDLQGLKGKVERWFKRQKGEITPLWVAGYYSRACDHWGVRLMVNQQPDQALHAFQLALDLNPYNACALVNQEWAQHWKKTGKLLERFSDEVMNKLAPFAGNWDLLLSVNGPMDEPTFRAQLAQVMARNSLTRQAAQEIQRVLALNPQDMAAVIMLGNIYVQGGLPDRGLELVAKVRSDPRLAPKDSRQQADLIGIEAWAAYAKGDTAKAETLLRGAQDQYPQFDAGFFILAQMYMALAEERRAEGKQADYLNYMTNALNVFDKEIKVQPENLPALVNYGGLCAQLEDYNRAITLLTRAVELNPSSSPARLNRAISCLRAGRNEEARADYDYLLKLSPTAYRAYYGLAEVAYRQKDWLSAANDCELYLRHAPPNTSEYFFMQKRLAELRKKVKR